MRYSRFCSLVVTHLVPTELLIVLKQRKAWFGAPFAIVKVAAMSTEWELVAAWDRGVMPPTRAPPWTRSCHNYVVLNSAAYRITILINT